MSDNYTINESSLDYSLFLAENNLVRSLALIDNKAKHITESTDYQILNESLADTIRQYLAKVSNSITQAFQKFREGLVDRELQNVQKLMNDNGNLLTSDFKMLYPDEFMVPDIGVWDKIVAIQLKEFEPNAYNDWKQSGALASPEEFIKHNYSEITNLGDPDKSIAENLKDSIFKPGKGQQANASTIAPFTKFINEYKSQVELISKQIDVMNNSNKNIETYLSQLLPQQEAYLGADRILAFLNEEENSGNSADAQPAPQNAPEPPSAEDNSKFRDSEDPTGEKAKQNNANQDRKNIATIYRANTKILSAEMRACNDIRKACQKIITNYINLQLKKNGVKVNNINQPESNEQQNQNTEQNTVPQADNKV